MKYKVCCPVCGRTLLQATPNAEISSVCHKCGSSLWIKVQDMGVCVLAKSTGKKEAVGSSHTASVS